MPVHFMMNIDSWLTEPTNRCARIWKDGRRRRRCLSDRRIRWANDTTLWQPRRSRYSEEQNTQRHHRKHRSSVGKVFEGVKKRPLVGPPTPQSIVFSSPQIQACTSSWDLQSSRSQLRKLLLAVCFQRKPVNYKTNIQKSNRSSFSGLWRAVFQSLLRVGTW